MGPPATRGAIRGGITGESFLENFRNLLVNPADYVLELVDSLDLTHEQVDRLDFLRDSLNVVNDSIGAALQSEIEELGAGGAVDPRALMQVIRPRMQEAQENVQRGLAVVRGTGSRSACGTWGNAAAPVEDGHRSEIGLGLDRAIRRSPRNTTSKARACCRRQ
jgi:hypothetical protein